jgi:hypothetical protein
MEDDEPLPRNQVPEAEPRLNQQPEAEAGEEDPANVCPSTIRQSAEETNVFRKQVAFEMETK